MGACCDWSALCRLIAAVKSKKEKEKKNMGACCDWSVGFMPTDCGCKIQKGKGKEKYGGML